jgi:transposase
MVSKELRKLISEGHKAGIGVKDMAQIFQVGRSTIYGLLAREDKTGSMSPSTSNVAAPQRLMRLVWDVCNN